MEQISIDDFKKIDVRVGTILSVEEVPETDKLLKLVVDFGEERRQIVSGIKNRVDDPQSLVSLKTFFVFNLAPRTIKGLESNGMLFAAGGEENFSFIVPARDIPNGTRAG